jgi:dihydrolipoamide dehydrogenase
MSDESTRLVVIGGGPGGYAAAFKAADLGLEVTLVDTEPNPGGVCLYRGCIPSKALLHAARVVDEARHADAFGVSFAAPAVDVARLRAWKDGVVGRLTGGLGQLAKQRRIAFVRGRATFVDAHTVSVALTEGGERTIAFDHAILATGSRPATIPTLDIGSARVVDSTGALELESVPKTLLVVGGGYIGLELGTAYAALGSQVSVVEMTDGLLPGADRDLVAVLAKRLEQAFDRIWLSTRVTGLEERNGGVLVRFEGEGAETEQTFERVLMAVGRKPNSQIPGLDRTRVALDSKGFIQVDAQRRTAEPHIFAIGDVAGEPMLAHKATHEGVVAAEAIAGQKVAFEPRAIPAVVFTDPEIAWCGLTEAQAKAEGREVAVSRFPWAASGRALTLNRPDGITKTIADPASHLILGVGIVGPGAGELIAEGVLAIEMGALASDLHLTIHPHPTMSETLMESAEGLFGQSLHFYRRRR